MKRLLRLYPPAWRARYEAEVADLLDELSVDRWLMLDLLRGAWVERARSASRIFLPKPLLAGGPPLFEQPWHRHPTPLALLALLLVLPTATLVALSVLAYELGVIGLQSIIEPILVALPTLELANLFVMIAPVLALAVALAPLVGIGLSRSGRELLLTFALRARGPNLVVIGLCLLVGIVATWHHVVEVMLEAGL
jgi:hypothetical protein